MIRRIVFRLFLVGCSLLILPGCWDRVEINDLAFVLSTAIDLEKDGSIRYSTLLPLPGSMGGASGGGGGTSSGGGKSYYIDSVVGKTMREAQAKLQQRMPRRMFLAHRRTFLVGEEFAKKGLLSIFDANPRSPESRMTTYLIIAKGKAYELLQTSPKFERFPPEAIRELAKSKRVIDMNMKDFALALSTPGSDPFTVYMGPKKSEKNPESSTEVEVIGYGQFRKDRMVGVLEGKAAAGLAWLRDHSITHVATFNALDRTMTARISDSSSSIKVNIQNNRLRYSIDVKATAKVTESSDFYDFSLNKNLIAAENQLSAYMKESIQATIKQMIDSESDSAQLGAYVWRTYPQLWQDQYLQRWPAALKEADFDIITECKLIETGLISDNVVNPRNGEKE